MKAMVLGVGLQGKAVIHDLSQSPIIGEIVAVDIDLSKARDFLRHNCHNKVQAIETDATDQAILAKMIKDTAVNILICMTPAHLSRQAALGSIEAEIPYVCTTYAGLLDGLDALAKEKNILLLPEMGFDPGIDFVLGARAVAMLDEVHGLNSYGAGIPTPSACDNPLNYKISWTFDGVLNAYTRPARLLKGGLEIQIPGLEIFNEAWVRTIDVPGVGTMETYPNGDAVQFIQTFNLGSELQEMGRYTTRWPGHCAFWRIMAHLGFLNDEPLELAEGVSIAPREFVSRHLTPKLQYKEDERDLAFLRVHAWGQKDGHPRSIIYDLIDYRDLETGLFAMNRTVGYTASIAAQMILKGEIKGCGVGSPAQDVNPDILIEELSQRGVEIKEYIE